MTIQQEFSDALQQDSELIQWLENQIFIRAQSKQDLYYNLGSIAENTDGNQFFKNIHLLKLVSQFKIRTESWMQDNIKETSDKIKDNIQNGGCWSWAEQKRALLEKIGRTTLTTHPDWYQIGAQFEQKLLLDQNKPSQLKSSARCRF